MTTRWACPIQQDSWAFYLELEADSVCMTLHFLAFRDYQWPDYSSKDP